MRLDVDRERWRHARSRHDDDDIHLQRHGHRPHRGKANVGRRQRHRSDQADDDDRHERPRGLDLPTIDEAPGGFLELLVSRSDRQGTQLRPEGGRPTDDHDRGTNTRPHTRADAHDRAQDNPEAHAKTGRRDVEAGPSHDTKADTATERADPTDARRQRFASARRKRWCVAIARADCLWPRWEPSPGSVTDPDAFSDLDAASSRRIRWIRSHT